MKKLIVLIMVFLIFLPVVSSSTLIPLSKQEMSQIVGQSGIKIEVKEEYVYKDVDRYPHAYFDEGYFVTYNWRAKMHVDPNVDDTLVIKPVNGNGPKEVRGNIWTDLKPREKPKFLTVEVGQSEIFPEKMNKCVKVSMPHIETHIEHASFRVGIEKYDNATNGDKEFGKIGIKNMRAKVFSGKIVVSAP